MPTSHDSEKTVYHPKSDCCNADVKVGGDDREGTVYFVCTKCGRACDLDGGKVNAQEPSPAGPTEDCACHQPWNVAATHSADACISKNAAGPDGTKESWEAEFDRTWTNVNGITVMDMPLKDFIRKVAKEAEERGYWKGIQEEAHGCYEHCKQARAAALDDALEAVERLNDEPTEFADYWIGFREAKNTVKEAISKLKS